MEPRLQVVLILRAAWVVSPSTCFRYFPDPGYNRLFLVSLRLIWGRVKFPPILHPTSRQQEVDMRYAGLLILSGALVVPSFAQNDTEGPANEKARKTYQEAFEYLQHRATGAALDSFKKAD